MRITLKNDNRDKIQVKLLLLKHKSEPVLSLELQDELNVSGSEIREAVRELREKGIPITSGSEGYGFAKDIDEIMPTILHLKSRAISMLKTIRNLERNFINPSSQADMFRASVIDDIIDEIKRE